MCPPRSRTRPSRDQIRIRGARQNNLKHLDLDLPLGELIVVTGVSGSGKSSLAFDTVYAEGQRRYVETFSPYARQFLDRMDRPQVDAVEGIPPAIAIDQTNPVRASRSTVGTMTELNDHLKLLFARAADLYCHGCGAPVGIDTPGDAADKVIARWPAGSRVAVSFGVRVPANFSEAEVRQHLAAQGYERVLEREGVDELIVVADRLKLGPRSRGRLVEAFEAAFRRGDNAASAALLDADGAAAADWLDVSNRRRCECCQIDYREPSPALFSFNSPVGACPVCRGFGRVMGIDPDLVVPDTRLSLREGAIKPFQSETNAICQRDLVRYGAAKRFPLDKPWHKLTAKQRRWVFAGEGDFDSGKWYGVDRFFRWQEGRAYKMHVRVMLSRYRSYSLCPDCDGARLIPEALAWRLGDDTGGPRCQPTGFGIDASTLPGHCPHDLMQLPLSELHALVRDLSFSGARAAATDELLAQIRARLSFLVDAGVGYLSLDRQSRTLSGGEVQRINLTTALGTSLVNTLFVLDEPSIGLHPRDLGRIATVLHRLRDAGNSLLVVEHDPQLMLAADRIIDMGPGPGARGGEIVFNGSPKQLLRARGSRTGDYLAGRARIEAAGEHRRPGDGTDWLRVRGARAHNLKKIDAAFPIGHLSCLTGVSGSGKSTLLHEVLYRGLMRQRGVATEAPGEHEAIERGDDFADVVMVDQSPIGKSARSNPASYTGAFDAIRKHFATLPLSRERDYTAGSFSFNSQQQKCPGCGGSGFEHVEMQFLSDVYLRCPDCNGRRYRDELLEVTDTGADGVARSISDVLGLSVAEARAHFARQPKILEALEPLVEVGLDYVALGQPVPTLSGGEAQRLKIAAHLVAARLNGKRRPGPSLFLFDEPTSGLHFEDIARLLQALRSLQSAGHTLIVIEHNLELIEAADWVIDLGPEGGDGGGELLVAGTQQALIDCLHSHTGAALAASREAVQQVAEAPAPYRARAAQRRISVENACEHNLKAMDVQIPREQFSVITGVSGSGKSTLAFDIVFAEGQRRYLESLNAYARQFVQPAPVPLVDRVAGIPPTVAIEQRTSRGGQKSTVGTATEIHHFLRLLFQHLGSAHCPLCDAEIAPQQLDAISAELLKRGRNRRASIHAPLIVARKGYYTDLAAWAKAQGYAYLRVDGELLPTDDWPRLDRYKEHDIDLPIGEVVLKAASRAKLDALLASALQHGSGQLRVAIGDEERLYSTHRACPNGHGSLPEPDPRLFSYNSRHGWCPRCVGTGLDLGALDDEQRDEGHDWRGAQAAGVCPDCRGARLNPTALAMRFRGLNIAEVSAWSTEAAAEWFESLALDKREACIGADVVAEIAARLRFLCRVGLGYLSLDRGAPGLSGGEAQRIRLAAQLGSTLRGVCYVLDEPTIGLHPSDNARLIDTLKALRDRGNTVLVVEHDEATIRAADHVIDIGPGAGERGGQLVAQGSVKAVMRNKASLTGRMLAQPLQHPMPREAEPTQRGELHVRGACANNLKRIDVALPLGLLVGVGGVSGSGKSSLVREVIAANLQRQLAHQHNGKRRRGRRPAWVHCDKLTGFEAITRLLEVDQTPIGRTPRSCPATYVGVWDPIRRLFANTTEANLRGYGPSRFSFNAGDGRCPVCDGQGMTRVEMNFLPDVKVICDACGGDRFNRETLGVHWRGRTIGDVLNLPIDEAVAFFDAHPSVHRPLQLLQDVGLGYLRLGQHSPTLSGGEAQRLKLVTELAKARPAGLRPGRGASRIDHTLYVLDEPTVGLHMADVEKLIRVLHRLVASGHSVVVIEHNTDVLAECDHLIELGPGGGAAGGRLLRI